MAYDRDYDDLSYGSEIRHRGDTVGLPHDQDESEGADTSKDIYEGQAVTFDGTHLLKCTADTDALVGVLQNYNFAGDSGGTPQPKSNIKQDRNATVRTRGVVKAEVESTVSAGDALVAGTTTEGVFDTAGTESQSNSAVALSDAREQDDAYGNTRYYAEVLLR